MDKKDFKISKTVGGVKIIHKETGLESVEYKCRSDANSVVKNILNNQDKTFIHILNEYFNDK